LSGKEYRVNGLETTDWRCPKYDIVGDVSVHRPTPGEKLSSNREKRTEKSEKIFSAPAERAKKKTTPFPDNFALDADMALFAKEHGVNPEVEFAAFCDHHQARGNTFRDWRAAWRTWVRNSIKFQGGFRNNGDASRRSTIGEGFARTLEAAQSVWGSD
jgi:hypothetical protein